MPGSRKPGPVERTLREGPVKLTRDGLDLSPGEFARLLDGLQRDRPTEEDSYSLGGVVGELEALFARLLGKERAIFMPTGTLANHLAVRRLCGTDRPRVIVQQESHLYNDSGDCAQRLSGLHLVPLAPGKPTFTLEEVLQVLSRTAGGRVRAPVGAVVIESPVRRCHNQRFAYEEMQRISSFCRRKGIGLHMDGARLFIESAFTGVPVRTYADLFDTVYVSLYKSFNSGSGAVLAGPARLLDGLHHERRMFGGGLPRAWPFAAVALPYVEGHIERLRRAIRKMQELARDLQRLGLRIETFPGGTNVMRMIVERGNPERLRKALAKHRVILPRPLRGVPGFLFKVNETLNRDHAGGLLEIFKTCLR